MYMLYSGKALKATYDKYNPPTKDGRQRERETRWRWGGGTARTQIWIEKGHNSC